MMKYGAMYWPVRAASSPFRRTWFDIELDGERNVPADGPVVLAANHISFLDSFLLMNALPRKVMFMGKAEYMDSWKTKVLFPAAGMIPVDRSGKGIATSLHVAAEVLEHGGGVGIFPEGTRTADGAVHQGHTGAAHLAVRTGAALIPVGVQGTDQVMPPDAKAPARGGHITLRFGAPLDVSHAKPGATERRAITGELMQNIAELADRPYVDTPAPQRELVGGRAN